MTAGKRPVVCAAILVGILAAGCQQEQARPELGLPQEFLQADYPPQEPVQAEVVRRDYRLREGDSLEIIYHVRHRRAESYKIKIQDVIVIRFPFHPNLSQTEQVQSDGTLRLDLVGEVYVFDRTIGDVQQELDRRYGAFLKDPVMTVSFKQSNVKIAELKEAIKTAPRGQSRLVPIAPDGTISLPFIGHTRAAGLTIGELHRELNQGYRDIGMEELEVTVNIESFAPSKIYVLGEVRIPGVQLNRTGLVTAGSDITLLQAIAQAGGYIPARSELSKVMLVRRHYLDRPQIAIINVHQLLENRSRSAELGIVADESMYRYDLYLEDGDLVYVPTNAIAKRADYIEYVWTRGIRAVGGFTSSASYTVSDAVDWVGPNP